MDEYLYQYISKEKLTDMATSFHKCLNLSISILNAGGSTLINCGQPLCYCRLIQSRIGENACLTLRKNACRHAIVLGESYIFSCHANLYNILFPLTLKNNTLLGSVLVGPFVMEQVDSSLLEGIDQLLHAPLSLMLDLYESTNEIPVLLPSQVTPLSKLIYYIFSDSIGTTDSTLNMNQNKLYQQSKINETIQRYKSFEYFPTTYPYQLEQQLITKVKNGNISKAKEILNELMGIVFFSEGSSLSAIKNRSIELSALLSRAIIESGAEAASSLRINNQFIQTVQETKTLDDLCFRLQEVVEEFTNKAFPTKDNHAKIAEPIREALRYISRNFNMPLTLQDVAEQVNLSAPYFSTLFKQVCDTSFKEYLTMIRIEESKRLLANTSDSIIDIAVAVGFSDQSYFTKVFRKYTGITPKQYR